MFLRMNSFTVPLNPEEQRHAEFQGEFKWFMRNLTAAYAEAFRQAGVFSQKSLVRMQDQKLLTEIASAYFDGIKTTNKRTLDGVYAHHDKPTEFPNDDQANLERRLRPALDQLCGWHDLYETPLMKPHQAYSLVLALMHMQEPLAKLQDLYPGAGLRIARENVVLVNLTRLAEVLEGAEELAGALRPFVQASSERTNVAAQRAARFKWFCRALADDLPD